MNTAINTDKRKGNKPVPQDIERFLNEDQLAKLTAINRFGWDLSCIRRPLFQTPIVMVINPDAQSIVILEEDGQLNMHPDLQLRC